MKKVNWKCVLKRIVLPIGLIFCIGAIIFISVVMLVQYYVSLPVNDIDINQSLQTNGYLVPESNPFMVNLIILMGFILVGYAIWMKISDEWKSCVIDDGL